MAAATERDSRLAARTKGEAELYLMMQVTPGKPGPTDPLGGAIPAGGLPGAVERLAGMNRTSVGRYLDICRGAGSGVAGSISFDSACRAFRGAQSSVATLELRRAGATAEMRRPRARTLEGSAPARDTWPVRVRAAVVIVDDRTRRTHPESEWS